MNKLAFGGIFGGADFSNFGGKLSVPGTSGATRQAVPQPPKPPIQTPKPLQQPTATTQTAAPQPYTSTQQPSSMDYRTPQGFAQWASMLRPVTQGVLQHGGIPALGAIYGAVSGSKDWQKAMSKTGRVLPLPVMQDDDLVMPKLTKYSWGKGYNVTAPKDTAAPLYDVPQNNANTSSGMSTVGGHLGGRIAADITLRKTVPALANKETLRAATPLAAKVPGVRGGVVVDSTINSALGVGRMLGIKPLDADPSFWEKPKIDAKGNQVIGQDGKPTYETGWNPAAFGTDMKEYDRQTTPDGTIALGRTTGNSYIDRPLGYMTSGLQAYSDPVAGAYRMGRFGLYEANPAADLINPNTRKAWNDVATGNSAKDLSNASIPLITANAMVSKPWMPSAMFDKGGDKFQHEASIYKAQNRYHPIYNRDGEQGRPAVLGRLFNRLWY